ncbi:MAG: endolytic transglycosylase MltG [Bacteriovoracaceae bacterium]
MIKKTLFFMFVVGPLIACLMVGVHVWFILNQTYQGPDKVFIVKNGDTFGKINQRLSAEGIISNARVFHHYAKYKGVLTKFRAGSYTIPRGAKMSDVLDTLVFGQPNLTSITVPEGKNMYEIAKLLNDAGVTTEEEFLKAVQHPDIIAQLEIQATSLEGYLYPETYKFAPNTPAKDVAKTMIDLFKKKTEGIDWTHPFLNKHQVVILASVVEKETGAKAERPIIAGVFTNRLKKRMRLESDPTTVYGIWSRYKGNIRKDDLLEMTPYNTYKVPALPAGPISNPSLEAIEAVLHPQNNDYLFFVSKNDGTHVFTKTYQEHVEAVNNWQRNARARQGKSWRDLKQ